MSELLQKTREQWNGFSKTQKVAAIATNALTFSRPILSGIVTKRGLDKNHEWTTADTALLGTAYLTDLEGGIARAANAQTKLGGVLDPLADKIATNSQEIALAYRGEEAYSRVGLRLARDIGISVVRKVVSNKTQGSASISAGWSGKANTAFRKGVNLFATSPLGDKYPKTRTALQIASTATTLISGAITAKKLWDQTKKH